MRRLLSLIPAHQTYCEPFGGSGALLLNKPASPVEVFNDIDGNLMNLFTVVRDHQQEFADRIEGLLYSRELYETWRRPIVEGREDNPADPIERAVQFYYVIRSAFFSHPRKGWRMERGGKNPRRHPFSLWAGVKQLDEIASRLTHVYIDHVDFRRCFRNWDSPRTFFFVDPPYYGAEPYLHTLSPQDHQDLAAILAKTQGKWLLTYNDVAVIRRLYAKFPKQRIRQPLSHYKVELGEKRPCWTQLIIRNFELSKKHENHAGKR